MNRWICILVLLFLSCKTPPFTQLSPVGSNQNPPKSTDKFIFFVHSNNQINGRITMDNLVRLSPHNSVQGYLYTQGNRLLLANWESYQSKLLQENYQYALIMYVRPSNTDAVNSNEAAFIKDYLLFIDPCIFNPICNFQADKFIIETKLYSLQNASCIWQSTSKTFENVEVHSTYLKHAEQVIQQLQKQGFMVK